MKCNSLYVCLPVAAAWGELVWGMGPICGLDLPSPGSGGAGPSLEPPLDLGTVPVAEMMKDNLKSYTPRCEIKDPCNINYNTQATGSVGHLI